MKAKIEKLITQSIETKKLLLSGESVDAIGRIADALVEAYRARKKVVIFGNGGSASDAQHFAAELVCRFEKDRRPLPALALSENSALMTAIANDYDFKELFSRQVEAFVEPGDVAIGITTSGRSPNVLAALEAAGAKRAVTVAFTGLKGWALKTKTDISFIAPSETTARVQECHILAIHIICSIVEEKLFA